MCFWHAFLMTDQRNLKRFLERYFTPSDNAKYPTAANTMG